MRRPLLARALTLCMFVSAAACASAEGEADEPTDAKTDQKSEPKTPSPETPPPAETPPPGVKTKDNLPVRTESEPAAQDAQRDSCVRDCVESKKMEARGPEAIEADCRQSCMDAHPVEPAKGL